MLYKAVVCCLALSLLVAVGIFAGLSTRPPVQCVSTASGDTDGFFGADDLPEPHHHNDPLKAR
jgi:hypothetical protein